MQRNACSWNNRMAVALWLALVMLLVSPLSAVAEDNIYISIRRYPGVSPEDLAEAVRVVDEGFLPMMRESEGFIGYFVLTAEDVFVSINIFERREQALATNEAAREFVAEFMAPLLTNPPRIVEGSIDAMIFALLNEMSDDLDAKLEDEGSDEGDDDEMTVDDEMMVDDGVSSLFAALRIYDNYDLSRLDEANELIETLFIPIHQEAEGFFGYLSMNNGDDVVAGLSIYDNEENALAANEKASGFLAEYMVEWLPEDPILTNGRLGVAALAEVHGGANLIDGVMMDKETEG